MTVKRAITPFIKITPQRFMGLTFAVLQKNGSYLPFFTLKLKNLALWNAGM